MKYRVIFRTCDQVQSLHNVPRPFGLEKRALIKLCFESLTKSLHGFDHTIHIVGDKLSEEMLDYFKQFPVTFTLGNFGNDESIRTSLRLAFEFDDDDWVYLCEDDYLHALDCFARIDELLRDRKEILLTKPASHFKRLLLGNRLGELDRVPLFIHPPDYPDRYHPRERKASLLFLSRSTHWRQVSSTTFTFLAQARSFKKYRKVLLESAAGARDGYLSKRIYGTDHFIGKALCLSPIPGLATHMHEGVMTPFVDWYETVPHDARLKKP